MSRNVNIVCVVFLTLLVTWSAAMFDDQTESAIDQAIRTGIGCRNIPGLATAIVKDGQVMLSKGYGVKDLDTLAPVTSDTLFQIASTTKAFTGALLSNVVAGNSSLRMSTNVYRTFPGGFRFNNTLRSTYATMEDLLAHRMGVPRNNYARLASDYSIQRFARKIRYLPHKGGFRDSFFYNDIMYGLAALITEQLGQRPWKQQIQETIFNPLGMSRSTFVEDVDFENDDVAAPYVRESRRNLKASIDFIRHWGRNAGSGNIVSSANDMSKWMLMLLNDGKDSSGVRVLRERVVEQIFSPQNVYPSPSYANNYRRPVAPESFIGDGYSLGWKTGYYRGIQMIHHSGSTFGYRAFLTLLPEENVGVVSLMTGSDYQFKFRTALHTYLMDQALGYAPWINSSSICTFPDPWRSSSSRRRTRRSVDTRDDGLAIDEDEDENEEEDLDDDFYLVEKRADRVPRTTSLSLSRYQGRFRHAAYGTLEVRYNRRTRSLQLQYGIGLWRLEPSGRRHAFDGQWLRGPPTINKSFRFKARGTSVYAVEGTGFEPSKPPVFYRR